MQRRVLIILPTYKKASYSYYTNTLQPQTNGEFWVGVDSSYIILENEDLYIRVINDSALNDNVRGSRFHNVFIHEDCYISDEVYCDILAPMVVIHKGDEEVGIRHFEDNVEAYIMKYLLRLGGVETEDDRKRKNFIKDFTDTPDDKK